MSLVVERTQSTPTTATSTTAGQEGVHFSSFAFPESPSAASLSLDNQLPSTKSKDPLFLRTCRRRSSSVRTVLRTPPKRLSCDIHCGDSEGESFTPVKKVARLLVESDPLALFDSNSRDSGFESEASRLSYSLSTPGTLSNPGTPSSSTSSVSVASSACLTGLNREDSLSVSLDSPDRTTGAKSVPLCLWDNCKDPDLLLEDEESRKNLLGHLLARHIQPLEAERQKTKEKDQVALFKCLWGGCKVYGKGSKVYSWLEGHIIERHAGPRPFVCPLPGCLLRFGSKALAERHINSHFACDDHPSKGKLGRMTPSSTPKKPSPLAASISDASKSPSSKQRVGANTRSSARRKLMDERSQRYAPYRASDKQGKACDYSPLRRRRENVLQKQQTVKEELNGLKRIGDACKSGATFEYATNTRRKIKQPLALSECAHPWRGRQRKVAEEKSKRKTEVGHAKKGRLASPANTSLRKQCGFVSVAKKANIASNAVGNKAASSSEKFGTTSANGVVSAVKRKAVRVRSVPEDAFDAMYTRAMHVLAARCAIASMKMRDTLKKRNATCHKCSGIPRTVSSSLGQCHRVGAASRSCMCSDYVTFHTKVLAKRTCSNGKEGTSCPPDGRERQLFCSWTPSGLLSSKWMDESSFQPIVGLPRSLFPSLAGLGTSRVEPEKDCSSHVNMDVQVKQEPGTVPSPGQAENIINSFIKSMGGKVDESGAITVGDQSGSTDRQTHVIVCDKEAGEATELPLEEDGSLALTTLQIEFVGATGLKYRNPLSGLMRILKVDEEGKFRPPPEGWKSTHFVACVPRDSQKRPWMNNDDEADGGSTEPPCKKVYVAPLTSSAPGPVPRPPLPPHGMPMHMRPRFPGGVAGPRRLPAKVFAYCDVCRVGMNSESQSALHYAGRKHQETVARGGARPPGPRMMRPRGPRPSVMSTQGAPGLQMRWPPPRLPMGPAQDFTRDASYAGFGSWSSTPTTTTQ